MHIMYIDTMLVTIHRKAHLSDMLHILTLTCLINFYGMQSENVVLHLSNGTNSGQRRKLFSAGALGMWCFVQKEVLDWYRSTGLSKEHGSPWFWAGLL